MNSLLQLLQQADVKAIYFLNIGLRNPVFDFVMPAFDSGKSWRLPLLFAWLALMIFGKRRDRLLGLGAVMLVALTDPISSQILKPLAARIRPCNVLPGLYMWKDGAWLVLPDPVIEIYKGSYSMPSSHAVNAGAQALWWGWGYPKMRGFWWGLGAIIGFSRIYDGVHWPGDVIAGWILAALLFLAAKAVWERWVLGRKVPMVMNVKP